MSTLRDYRQSTKLSQAQFALRLGVATDTYRMWDSGRREPPTWALSQARELAGTGAGDRLVGLRALSRVLGVSVYRLREAARDGRLAVVYDTRVVFGRPVPRATRTAGEAYKRQFYGRKAKWTPRPTPPKALAEVPIDYDQWLIELRSRLGLSQSQLAAAIGAAGKAVVYQWETRKRVPSSVLWSRLVTLFA